MTKTNFNWVITYFLDDCESKWKLSVDIWFLLLIYLSLWDMLSLRLVSKQTFVVVNKYSRSKKYLSFSKQISTSLWNNFVNKRIKILYEKVVLYLILISLFIFMSQHIELVETENNDFRLFVSCLVFQKVELFPF